MSLMERLTAKVFMPSAGLLDSRAPRTTRRLTEVKVAEH
jgi:hypothetical protein